MSPLKAPEIELYRRKSQRSDFQQHFCVHYKEGYKIKQNEGKVWFGDGRGRGGSITLTKDILLIIQLCRQTNCTSTKVRLSLRRPTRCSCFVPRDHCTSVSEKGTVSAWLSYVANEKHCLASALEISVVLYFPCLSGRQLQHTLSLPSPCFLGAKISPAMPPPKRGGNARRRPKRSDASPYKAPDLQGAGDKRSQRPTQQQTEPSTEQATIDVASLYNASTQAAKPTPYADLKGTLDNRILEGLEGMGFQ